MKKKKNIYKILVTFYLYKLYKYNYIKINTSIPKTVGLAVISLESE